MTAKVKCTIKCDRCGTVRKTEIVGPTEFRESLARHGWIWAGNTDTCPDCVSAP